ncbi:MAG: hypothetical protein ACI84C_000143 [Flavobacteriales bacterium]|jgi:hypothetical protein
MVKNTIGLILVLSLVFMSFGAEAQMNVTTFGIQIRPIIPSKFFNSGTVNVSQGSLEMELDPKVGYNFGMVIRRGFTKFFSVETGINIVRRNYALSLTHATHDKTLSIRHAFVGYELPIQGLIYVQLGDRLWMNAAGGVSLDFYPSNTFEQTSDQVDTLVFVFEQRTNRYQWMQVSLIANYGFEWRSKESGYLYLGASYHRPFGPVASSRATFILSGVPETLSTDLSGSYLTLDLRYYFHEKPDRKKKIKKNKAASRK